MHWIASLIIGENISEDDQVRIPVAKDPIYPFGEELIENIS